MTEAWIIDAVRSPMGRRKGSLSGWRGDDLAAHVLKALTDRQQLPVAEVEDVITGCVTQVGEQGWNIGRQIPLIAGFPVEVCGMSINRMCGSSLQAVASAAQAIKAGDADLVVAAGVEMMSRVPMSSDGGDLSKQLTDRFLIIPQGLSAEMIADNWGFSRRQLDEFSLESHRRALHAMDAGWFQREIVPVPVQWPDGRQYMLEQEETPRRDTNLDKLTVLPTSFKIDGVITAANSSQITDGAAAVLLASPDKARALGLKPRARVLGTALAGVEPTIMLTGVIPATRKLLGRLGLTLDDMDVVEVNEAFAPVVLAWAHDLGVSDMSRVNPNGGAIALGHPLGASGARITATLLSELERRGGRFGLATMCIGFGQAIATVFERL